MGITTALNTTVGSNPFLKMMSKLLVALLSPSPLMLRLDTWATPPPSSTPTPTGPERAPPTASPPATDADPDTPMARGPLTPRLRLIPPSCTELTDTDSPTPMELTPMPMVSVPPMASPERSPPPPPLDTRTCTARGLLMPRLRPTPPFCTELTDTVPTPTLPMELTPTDTDTVLPESLVTPEPPPPSSPGLPRVSARGLLMSTPPSFTEHTAMAPLDTPLPRDTPALPAPSSPSPDCTKKQPI